MRFDHVQIASLAVELPDERILSDTLEEQLAPIYDRLSLNVGRLELMTGIRERRFFPPGTRPSTAAAAAGRRALTEYDGEIGLLVHASVCRDFLEPATASVVHHHLELPETTPAFDLSNACLGFLNAMVVVAEMIERGSIEAGLVVAAEDGRPLVEATIASLLERADQVTRDELKGAFASLTIGSGAAACVLARGDGPHRLLGATALADTKANVLCQGGQASDLGPLMTTDSEALLHAGIALAGRTFGRFLDTLAWTRDDLDRYVTHQVGSAHRRLLVETLELEPGRDHPTVATLGNMGSVSVPASLALAVESGRVQAGHRVGLLGIGSGLQCQMLGARW